MKNSDADPAPSLDDSIKPTELFYVVRNAEEQYSIWPNWRDLPLGWHTVGQAASREDCLDWIEKNWTDMRPLSVRQFLEQQGKIARS